MLAFRLISDSGVWEDVGDEEGAMGLLDAVIRRSLR